MSLDICIYLWYYHHNQGDRHIYYHRKIHYVPSCVCVCVIRTSSMRSTFNKFLSTQRLIVNYRHYVLQEISTTDSSCITVTLYSLNNILFVKYIYYYSSWLERLWGVSFSFFFFFFCGESLSAFQLLWVWEYFFNSYKFHSSHNMHTYM